FANDIAALPHLFRLLWRFWMLRDRMAEGRAWVDELRARESSLDDVGRAELWLTSATAASEVGDDDGAAAAAGELKRLQARIADRTLQSAMQIALSWVLPAAGDLDGAKAAASTSLQGFREQDEPMMAINAVFTLGLQEMATGDFDAAHRHLSEVHASRGQFGDHWLASVACAQLGWLAAEAGRLDEAHALLDESVQSLETERS